MIIPLGIGGGILKLIKYEMKSFLIFHEEDLISSFGK
jgi:hypothetical protein